MNILKNKNCFLTGATGGIGSEITKQLAINGCNLFLTATTRKALENLQAELKNINNRSNG